MRTPAVGVNLTAMTLIATAHLTSRDGYAQDIKVGRHGLVADEPTPRGGKDEGPAPFALVLAGLAACTAITLQMYAGRKGWDLGLVRVDLRLSEEQGTRRIERLMRFDARVTDEQRTRLLEIADKTPVTLALKSGFVIDTRRGD
jgi:putative redox protein